MMIMDDTSAKFYVLRTTEGNIRISTTRLVYDTLISDDMIQECLNHKKKRRRKWNRVTYSQYQLAFHQFFKCHHCHCRLQVVIK